MPRSRGIIRNVVSTLLLSIVLSWSLVAVAAPRGAIAGEPKRSYGSIDVIMYQTSW
ncbi:MAG: hypothetical protein AABZ15_04430 [Nitrospirota bacterium]